MSETTIRPLKWKAYFGGSGCLRPAPMPSADCPVHQEWVGINRCNACPAASKITINYKTKSGEVHCNGQ